MNKVNRRHFIKSTALTAAAASITAKSWAAVTGSNSDIRVAVVGFGGRGQSHIEAFSKMSGVRLAALCDVDKSILGKEVDKLKKRDLEVEQFGDIRKLL